MKTCRKCGKEKPEEAFATDRGALKAKCNECRSAENRAYRERQAQLRCPYSRVLPQVEKTLARRPWARGHGVAFQRAVSGR